MNFTEIFTRRYIKSLLWGFLERDDYRHIRAYCMFIGYQRSGHSFIGAMLDAHPNIAMGMEVDALKLIELGYSRNQLYYCLANNSRIFTRKLKNVWTGYSYAIEGEYQGKYEKLLIIGDKKGGKSTLRLDENKDLLKKLKNITGNIPVKIIHVIRNPYDNISTMVRRHQADNSVYDRNLHEKKIKLYFRKVEINNKLRQQPDLEILDVYHEKIIEKPQENIQKIMDFIGVEASDKYIEDCTSVTYKKPHLSRYEIEWPDDLKIMVNRSINKYLFLKHYTFDQ